MAICSNCGIELSPWETGLFKPELCSPCSKATPEEKVQIVKRRENMLARQLVNVLNTFPQTVERRLLIGLQAGKQITVTKLMLYPEPDIHQFLSLKAKAQKELAGFSTGIGFWGSPEWAIGGAVALGFVESLVSDAKTRKGFEILNEATHKQAQLRTRGVFFDIHEILENWQPNPAAWRAMKAPDDYDASPFAFIHNGDEFIWIEVDGKPTAIRWASVESYQLA